MGNNCSIFSKRNRHDSFLLSRAFLPLIFMAAVLLSDGFLLAETVTNTGTNGLGREAGAQELSGYAIAVYCNQTEVSLAGAFTVVVKVRHGPKDRLAFQGLEKLHESLSVTSVATASHWLTPLLLENRWVYTVAPSQTGAFHFPALTVTVFVTQEEANRTVTLASAPVYLDVYGATDRYGFSETGLSEGMRIKPWTRWIPWIVVVWFLIPSFLIIRRAFSRPGATKGVTEKPKVIDDLTLLEALKKEYYALLKTIKEIETPEQIKEFYYRLSQFIRSYIDAAYHTQLLMKTPEEIRHAFLHSKEIETKTEEEIIRFLRQCDSIKYRPVVMPSISIDADIKSFKSITASVSKRKIG